MNEVGRDMSIHVYEVDDTMTGAEFGAYLQAWGCTPLRPIYKWIKGKNGKTKQVEDPALTTFICMKEVNGYQETWVVSGNKPSGEITQMTRSS